MHLTPALTLSNDTLSNDNHCSDIKTGVKEPFHPSPILGLLIRYDCFTAEQEDPGHSRLNQSLQGDINAPVSPEQTTHLNRMDRHDYPSPLFIYEDKDHCQSRWWGDLSPTEPPKEKDRETGERERENIIWGVDNDTTWWSQGRSICGCVRKTITSLTVPINHRHKPRSLSQDDDHVIMSIALCAQPPWRPSVPVRFLYISIHGFLKCH